MSDRGTTLALTLGCKPALAENIVPVDDGSRYAYVKSIGWINLKPSFGPGVIVTDTAVKGYVWGENIGWINMQPAHGGVVNDGDGYLSGYAWAENAGWINLHPLAVAYTLMRVEILTEEPGEKIPDGSASAGGGVIELYIS